VKLVFYLEHPNDSRMPMRLRLAIHGKRNDRIFHLVAVNQRSRRNAKPTELLGVYDPRVRPGGSEHKTVEWSVGRIRYWLSVGAIPTKSVVKLLEMVRHLSFVSSLVLIAATGKHSQAWLPIPFQAFTSTYDYRNRVDEDRIGVCHRTGANSIIIGHFSTMYTTTLLRLEYSSLIPYTRGAQIP